MWGRDGLSSGGIIRWYKLARQGNGTGALAALTWDRLADTVGLALVGVAAWRLSRPCSARTLVGPTLFFHAAGLVTRPLPAWPPR